MKTKQRGNGLRLVEEGGRFRFRVESALAYWTIKVVQLTPEEAERRTQRLVLDLDPGPGVPLQHCAQVALTIRLCRPAQ